ncbi:MAG: hypothetical protein ACREPL_00720 [Rhodanobacteraceae bacterium]
MTPTQRTLAALHADGWTAKVVERWNPHARVRHDLFGIVDILAARARETLAVQVTAGSCVSAHVHKLTASNALPMLAAAGWRVEVHGWRKVKVQRGGRATRWQCRIVPMADNTGQTP